MSVCIHCRDTGRVDRGGYFNPATGWGEPPYEEPCHAPGCDAYERVALAEDAALASLEAAYVPEERDMNDEEMERMKQSTIEHRKRNFDARLSPSRDQDWIDGLMVLEVTTNGSQWQSVGLAPWELPKVAALLNAHLGLTVIPELATEGATDGE